MRIRKKLIFLHTVFSILLTSVLLIAVRPAVNQAVSEAEGAIASRAVRMLDRVTTRPMPASVRGSETILVNDQVNEK